MLRIFNNAKNLIIKKFYNLDDDVLFHKLAQIEDYKKICDYFSGHTRLENSLFWMLS